MIQEKLAELKIQFNIKEVISDFELNIHKALDDMLTDIEILGCFFHLAKAFKKKVDQKQMKKHYDNNPEFRRFIKQAVALSSLPLADLEAGMQHLKDNFIFEDAKEESFKQEFLAYIDTYWINGCFPPHVWSTWKRTGDFTNNNQEGYNSRLNKELKQQHPSPGILLCFLRRQIILAEYTSTESKVGDPGPRKLIKHKTNVKKRTNLKQNYQNAKAMEGADRQELVGEFLSNMGHNVVSSTLVGRKTDLRDSQDPNNMIDSVDNDTSAWQVNEESVLEEMEEGDNPYSGRRVGISRKKQEDEELRSQQWWRGAKCPSCKCGFTARSQKKQCHSCDKFTHMKKKCITMAEDNTVFLCKSCKPVSDDPTTGKSKTSTDGFACNICEFKSAFKYNLSRHMDSQHGELDDPAVLPEPEKELGSISVTEPTAEYPLTLENMLKELGLSNLLENFAAEGVDMDMLKSLSNEDTKECMKEVGVKRFGDRHKILQQISIEKRKGVSKKMDIPKETSFTEEPTKEPLEDTSESVVDQSTDILNRIGEEPVPESCPVDDYDESPVEPVEEHEEESVGGVNCKLCKDATQHVCRTCLKPVCNLVCSEKDPSSTNEMHRVHKQGDSRCILSFFECPMCGGTFETPRNLQEHIAANHEQESSLSLVSEASSGWMDETDNTKGIQSFGEKLLLENEDSQTLNLTAVNHEPETSLEELLQEDDEFEINSVFHTQKRIVQNLKDINFEEDSDDDREWNQIEEENEENYEEEIYCCKICSYTTKHEILLTRHTLTTHRVHNKRKLPIETVVEAPSKKKKTAGSQSENLYCDVCESKFTRKDNLKRHKLRKH